MPPPRLVVGITGASGAVYGVRLLQRLAELPVETHLIVSRWARVTIEHETDVAFADLKGLAHAVHSERDQAAPVSSGSFGTLGMIVAPCSVKTLAGIATGYADNLIVRAADVALKERRPLVLAVRETPLNAVHLRNMLTLAELGATIFPPMPAFYHRPRDLDEVIEYSVLRMLDQIGLGPESPWRWQGLTAPEDGL